MFQCFASNDMQSVQGSAQLRLGSVKPELIYRFAEQTLQPRPPVSMKCTAIGNPPPQFMSTLDGFPIPGEDSSVHATGQSFLLSPLLHCIESHCRGFTDGSRKRRDSRLSDAPGGRTVNKRTKFWFECWEYSEDEEFPVEIKVATSKTATVNGMWVLWNYSISTLAFTAIGDGVPSTTTVLCHTEKDGNFTSSQNMLLIICTTYG